MLRIYYGSESCDKEKFIFESVSSEQKTIIIVPDQFSLQMERDALEYYGEETGQTALLNLTIADFSSLGHKAVSESGKKAPELIDKYGRHMLLSVLIGRLADAGKLSVYENMNGRNSFTANANQLISEMKRYGTVPEDLESATEKTDSFLKMKLTDISTIFREYENSIEGRFIDSEDYIGFYGEMMSNSQLIRNSEIWIYGFDIFTPLNLEVIQRLLEAARCVNIVMTKDDARLEELSPDYDARILTAGSGEGLFDLTDLVINNLRELDEDVTVTSLSHRKDQAAHEGEHITCRQNAGIWESGAGGKITLVCATNIYAEADRVAAHIMELVREKGYRYGDITVICNDMEVRGGVLKRTFDRWKIPVFADRRRRVLHQPVVRFLLSFLDVIADGYEGDSIMEMASTGLMGWTRSDEELLTNYIEEAKIRSSKWKKIFTWTGNDDRGARYSEEELVRLNDMRQFIVDITEGARNEIGRRNSAGDKVRGLYSFLEEKFEIRNRIDDLIERQTQLGLMEGAAETAQSWNMICGLFTQILRVIGEDSISNVQLRDILGEGLEEMEIGLVPTSTDCVIIGTLQRTRISRTRSLIITSANEGILPLQTSDTGLLTAKELEALEELKLNITKKEDVRRQEEQLAIYRMFSLPGDELYVTCSLADQEGKSASPSGIFNVLKEIDGVRVLGDLGAEDVVDKIASKNGTLQYMADAMQGYIENGKIDDIWLAAMNWYLENETESMRKIRQGLGFDNRIDALGQDMAESLYFGDSDRINASASRLELYSSCPFRHFIQYGLKAEEGRKFEIDARSRGDVYHKALQILCKRLMPPEGTFVSDESSDWMTITEDDCRQQVEEILREQTAGYREGVYIDGRENQLQLERVIENCGDMAWAMIGQVRRSRTSRMYFEEPFGYSGGRIRPVEIELEGGRKAVLYGKIDRIDVFDVAGGVSAEDAGNTGDSGIREAVRIIDYKTGDNKIDISQIEEGYKLQLTMYMNAVCGSDDGDEGIGQNIEPAGVFYFKIKDIDVNADREGTPDEKGESVEDRIAKACKLEGLIVDDENIVNSMDQTLECGSSSVAVPVKKLKEGGLQKSGGILISSDEFKELCSKTSAHVERICREIQEGCIDIEPKMEKRGSAGNGPRTSCSYCEYKSICLFDTSFRQCRFEIV